MLKIIKYSILFFLTLVIVSAFSLFSGIKIDSFSFSNISISQLYIKLDKKLIVEIEDATFQMGKSSNKKMSSKELQEQFLKIPKILDFFEKIDIERLRVNDNEFTILINDREVYIDNKDINLSAQLEFNGTEMMMDIYSVYVKEYELTLWGKAKVDVSKNIFNFFGEYDYSYMTGELNIQSTEDELDFYVNTTKGIKSLKFLKELFRLDAVAEEWMYDNVQGDINLNYLYGKVDLNKKEVDLDSIRGQAIINNAKVKFHKDVHHADIKRIKIDYVNDKLSFDFLDPMFKGESLDGSNVYISNLTSLEKGEVYVNLATNSMLTDDVLDILKAFEINLPIKQLDGKSDSKLSMKIPYLAKRKMDTNGIFKLKDANLQLNNFKFLAKHATVVLKDTNVFIQESHVIHNKMLDADLKLNIDTKNSTATGDAKINAFEIKGEKDSIAKINNLNTALKIDFKKDTNIYLDALKTTLNITKESLDIDIEDLNLIYDYSNLLKTTSIKDGDLKINYFDEDNIKFNINAKNLDFPFEKDGKKITKLSAIGLLKGDTTTIKTSDSDIEIILKKNDNTLLKLKNIDISLAGNKSENSKELPSVDLKLTNSTIKIDEKHQYKTSWANISIKNSKVNFEGKTLGLKLPISKDSKKIEDLEVTGTYEKEVLNIQTKDKKLKLKYELPTEQITMRVTEYDVLYDTEEKNDEEQVVSYDIIGQNSNIIINDKYVAKATSYKFIFEKSRTNIDLTYNNTKFIYREDRFGNIYVDARNMNDTFLNSLISKNLIEGGSVNLSASGKDKLIRGKADIKDSKIVDLAILNNLLIFINTSPGLINPLLAIPSVVDMAANDGFNLNGYRVTKGDIEFSYNFEDRFLNMNQIFTKGNGIDFEGHALIDFKSSRVDSTLKLIFLKSYSKIVGSIPVINYVLLGDEKRVDTKVKIFGTLEKPEYKTSLAEEGVKAPLNLLKRIIISPFKLIESLGEGSSNESNEEKLNNEEIHKKNVDKLLNPKGNE